MTARARILVVVVLSMLNGLWAGPATGQTLPAGFSSQTASDLGGGLTGYDAAGNLYLLRPSWSSPSGQATLERISPSGGRTALTVPVANPQSMAVASDGRLFVIGWDNGNRLVRLDTDGTVTTLLTAGSNEYLNGVALTSAGTLVVGRNLYDGTLWRTSVAVVSSDGTIAREIATPLSWANAVRADRSGNALALGWVPPTGESSQWTPGLVRVNPETAETSVLTLPLSGFTTYPADIAVDPAGQTLLSLFNGGILARRSENGSVSTISADNWIWEVASNASGSAVFAQGWRWDGNTGAQVIQQVGADGTLTDVLTIPQNSSSSWSSVYNLAVGADGTLYGVRYQSGGNAYTYDIVRIANNTATSLGGSESNTSYISGLAVDADGNLVFTRSDGIFRLTASGTVTRLANSRTSYDRVRINPATGQVFVGGWDGGVAVLEADGTFTSIPLTGADGSTAVRIYDFTFDRDGNLIVVAPTNANGGVGRLYRVGAQGGTLTPYDLGVLGEVWMVPAFDANGNVWFPTAETSLEYLNPDGTLTPVVTGILGWNWYSLTFAPDGTLLLSSQWGSTDAVLITGFGEDTGDGGGAPGATAVPALPTWGIVLLSGLLGGLAWRARRARAPVLVRQR